MVVINGVSTSGIDSGRKIGVSPPVKPGVVPAQFYRIKIKMRQPVRDGLGIRRNGDFIPQNLEVQIRADLSREIAPYNGVRIQPNEKVKRPFPHGGLLGVETSPQ